MDGISAEGITVSDSSASDLSLNPSLKSVQPVSVVLDPDSGPEIESRKLPSSRYKGVVPQPNGRWGAQIYEKHQRVWLGTFYYEDEAARAYDVAAQRFRGLDAVTNFKPLGETEDSRLESAFLNSHPKAEIVDMLRKHTYKEELEHCNRNLFSAGGGGGGRRGSEGSALSSSAKPRVLLFEKSATPSDVGKLNRFVIPKQHAERHFPARSAASSKGLLLNFEDRAGRVWRFRYSYWNSSQSYVLTKGWSRFVKEKGLEAGDVVCFQQSTEPGEQLYIETRPRCEAAGMTSPPAQRPVQMVRIFGVNIFKEQSNGGGGGSDDGNNTSRTSSCVSVSGGCREGKRAREVELLFSRCNGPLKRK